MSLLHFPCEYFSMDWVSLATASAMVLASVASLAASQSRLWSLLVSVEVVASPSLVLSLPIMWSELVYKVGVSQINSVLFCTLYSALLCRSNLALPLKSRFKSIKKLTLFLHLQYAVVVPNGLGRSLNISNPLEMLCICEFDHCKKFPSF